MSPIRFEAELFTIGAWILLRLPKHASAPLPSRGMTMVAGTINGFPFKAPLEPDGQGSHWLRVDEPMRAAAGADAGDTVRLEIAPAIESAWEDGGGGFQHAGTGLVQRCICRGSV
jgi:hypothetical protein